MTLSKDKKSKLFIGALCLLAFTGVQSLLLDIQQFNERAKFEIPVWFLASLFIINILYFLSLWQIYQYRKWAVITLPLCILTHFCLMHQYMNSFLYADLFSIFFFISIGLLEIVFHWKKFR